MIRITHSCGDCGFITQDYEDFVRHDRRVWHRDAMKLGIESVMRLYSIVHNNKDYAVAGPYLRYLGFKAKK